jgi:putative oxidoreductase
MALRAGTYHPCKTNIRMRKRFNKLFSPYKDHAAIFIRLVVGWRLIAGVWEPATNTGKLHEVTAFFRQLKMPLPALSATVAVYAELICGILFIIGLWVRPAALIMIVTFIVAIAFAHIHDPITRSFPAWIILASSLFLLFNGAGKFSLDELPASTQ